MDGFAAGGVKVELTALGMVLYKHEFINVD